MMVRSSLRLRLTALKRHAAAKGPDGKSQLAIKAGKASESSREGVLPGDLVREKIVDQEEAITRISHHR